jgi:hypothetical protein
MILDATSSLFLPPPAPSIWLFRAILAILSWEVCDHFASIQEFRLEKNSNTHTHTHTHTRNMAASPSLLRLSAPCQQSSGTVKTTTIFSEQVQPGEHKGQRPESMGSE